MGTLKTKFTLAACATIALLAGCGGSQPLIGAPAAMQQPSLPRLLAQNTSGISVEAPTRLLYATNYNPLYWNITVYRANGRDPSPIRVISDNVNGPVGDCIDGGGTLYVANDPANGPGWISEYSPGKSKSTKIITKGISTPGYCAIDKDGNLWVTNIGAANVTEYERGSVKPHSVISNGIVSPRGIAIDKAGNIYVSNHPSSYSGDVLVYAPGTKSPSRTITDGLTTPIGLAVDANGTLYVANSEANNVQEYKSGKGDPYQTVTESMDLPVAVTVTARGGIYVVNEGSDVIVEFRPGSTKPSHRQISNDLHTPWGAAYFPPVLP